MKATIRIENSISVGRRVEYKKRLNIEYMVYPVVMLVEGVHQGIGTNPVYYSQEALKESAPNWSNMPVTVGHPIDQHGEHVMCNADGTIRAQWQIGHIENARYDNGKLRGELFINIEKVNKVAPGLLAFLQSGGRLEVSTGLYATDNGTPGAWNEEEYEAAIIEIIPDHLALLPGGTGACSWEDGCGVRVNAMLNAQKNEQEEKRMGSEKKEGTCCPEKVKALIANKATPLTEGDGKWLLGLNESQIDKLSVMAEAIPTVNEEEVNKAGKKDDKQPTTLEAWLATCPPEIQAMVNAGLEELDSKRESLIKTILESERNSLTEDTLKGLNTKALEGIARLIPRKNENAYMGANPDNHVAGNAKEEPYVPRTLSDTFAKKEE